MKNWMRIIFLCAQGIVFIAMNCCACFAKSKDAVIAIPSHHLSGQPFLTSSPRGQVFLSWVDHVTPTRNALRFAKWHKNQWQEDHVIAQGEGWFVNWADFPSILVLSDQNIIAHWLEKSSSDKYAYNVTVSTSKDGGLTWRKPFVPHQDQTKTEHGFVSMLRYSDSEFGMVWLDGRQTSDSAATAAHAHHQGAMSLRYARINIEGKILQESLLDERTCDCCQTNMTLTSHGPLAVYRDRSPTEYRDISVVRELNATWTAPKLVFEDAWEIKGCPVNGPATSSYQDSVAVAWFTGAQNINHINLAFSKDGGKTFETPRKVSQNKPIGRVDVLSLDRDKAIVSWLEPHPKKNDRAILFAQVMSMQGKKYPKREIAQMESSRNSGFPQMILREPDVLFAWVDKEKVVTTKVARARFLKN